MGLIAHFELDGDATSVLPSYGDAALTSGSWGTGKIEQAAVFNGSSSYLTMPQVIGESVVSSVSCWVYVTGWDASSEAVVFGWNQYDWGSLRFNSTTIYLRWNSATASPTDALSGSYSFSLNTWYNIVVAFSLTKATIYVNGTVAATKAITFTPSIYIYRYFGGYINVIGGPTSNDQYLNGIIDDIKFFDHAVSLKEAKELSKSIVLHYQADQLEEYTVNEWTKHTTVAFTNAFDGTNYNFGSGTDLQQTVLPPDVVKETIVTKVSRIMGGLNQRDYVAVDIASPINSVKVISFWYYGTYGTSIEPYNNDGYESLAYSTDGFTWSGSGTSVIIPVIPNKWQKLYVRITNNGVSAGTGWSWTILHYNVLTTTLPNTDFWLFTGWQLETKDHATPFTIGTRSDYISDNSGYGNHGLLDILGPRWSSSSKIGLGCLYYNGANYFSSKNPIDLGTVYSFSAWINMSSFTAVSYNMVMSTQSLPYIGTYDGVIRFSFNDVTPTQRTIVGPTLSAGTWYHIVATHDGTTAKLYVNNVLYQGTYSSYDNGALTAYVGRWYTGSYPWYGYIDDVRIYTTALTASDVLELYQTRAQIDNSGNVLSLSFRENSQFDYILNSNNLVINGDQRLATNYNFSPFSYVSDGYFYTATMSGTQLTDTYIDIDPFHSYQGEFEFRSENVSSTLYGGIISYDKNKAIISPNCVWHFANTETTLSSTLSNGDTVVNITSSANWNNSGTQSLKYFSLYDPTLEYPPYTYTRLAPTYSSVGTNTITLNAVWAGGTFASGTPVANGYTGGTYSYIYASGAASNTTWTKYPVSPPVITSGWGINETTGTFRYGTKYIRMLFLCNYNSVATSNSNLRNVKFWDLTDEHAQHYNYDEANLSSSGIFEADEINEVPTRGLIAHYDFEDFPHMPTGASPTYLRTGFIASDINVAWTANTWHNSVGTYNCTLSISGTSLAGAFTGTTGIMRLNVDPRSKRFRVRIMSTATGAINLNNDSAGNAFNLTANTWYNCEAIFDGTGSAFCDIECAINGTLYVAEAYVGDGTYSTTINDSLGLATPLTNTSGVTPSTGKVGKCAIFNSALNQRLECDSTYFKRDEFSVSLWFKTAGLGSGMTENGIFGITYGVLGIINSSGNAGFRTWNISGNLITSSGHSSLFDNAWHHMVCTYNNQGVGNLYIDNINRGTSSSMINRWNWTNNFYIGVDPNNTTTYRFNGSIDEVYVYNREIDLKEVDMLNKLGNTQSYIEENKYIYGTGFIES